MRDRSGMSPALVTVWFDYTCPHSYLGLGRIEELASGLQFEIDRRPFLMRPNSISEGYFQRDMEDGEQGRIGRRQPLYKPGEGIGTEPASNRSLNTLPVHAATAYAKEKGLDGQLFFAASKMYWEQGVDLGNRYTLRRITESVGLDWNDMWSKLESGGYHDLVITQYEEAKDTGVVQAPSFRIGGKLHSGPIDAEELGETVKAAIQAAK